MTRMIAWDGGHCPVDGETLVRVKVNVWSEPCGPSKAKDWYLGARDWWQPHADGLARIEAYEVVQ